MSCKGCSPIIQGDLHGKSYLPGGGLGPELNPNPEPQLNPRVRLLPPKMKVDNEMDTGIIQRIRIADHLFRDAWVRLGILTEP